MDFKGFPKSLPTEYGDLMGFAWVGFLTTQATTVFHRIVFTITIPVKLYSTTVIGN
jgi:hypothetical protein